MKPKVGVVECAGYDQVAEALLRLLTTIGVHLPVKKTVLVKPNVLSAMKPEKNVTTHPALVASVCRLLKEKGNRVIVEFDYTDGGLRVGSKEMFKSPQLTDSKDVPNVELAGEDKRWQKATAKIEGERLIAWSDRVDTPVHVRYCYANIPQPPLLYNRVGLPAAMFTSFRD